MLVQSLVAVDDGALGGEDVLFFAKQHQHSSNNIISPMPDTVFIMKFAHPLGWTNYNILPGV